MSTFSGGSPSIEAARITIKFVPDMTDIDAAKAKVETMIDALKEKWTAALDLRPMLTEAEAQIDRIIEKSKSVPPAPQSPTSSGQQSLDRSVPPVPDQVLQHLTEIRSDLKSMAEDITTIANNTAPAT